MTRTTDTERFLRSSPSGSVVIANAYLWWREASSDAVGLPGETPSRDPATKLVALHSGLLDAVGSLQDVRHEVVLVQAIPHWGDDRANLSWAGCSVPDMLGDDCNRHMPLAEAVQRQGDAARVLRDVSAETDAGLLDLSSELCPNRTCSVVATDGLIRYRDGTHITVPQSEALTAEFTTALAG